MAGSVISPQHAQKILEANLINLAKKAQEGRPLTSQEILLLQGIASGDDGEGNRVVPVWAKNQVELATYLRVDRKTIQRWLRRKGNPGTQPDGRYNVAAWREWAKREGLRGGDRHDDVDSTRERARNILLQNEKLAFQIGVLKKEYVPVADVERWGGELGAAIRKVVTQLHLVAPSVVGLPVPDAELRLKEVEDEIIEQLHSLGESMAQWKREPVA